MRINETSLSYHMEDGTNGVPAGYKQTEVGLIPSDWEVRPLGALVTITSGESPSHFRFGPVGIPYFKVEQLNNSPKYLGSEETDYFLVGSPRTIPAGSVVFPKRGASIMLNKIRLLKASGYMDTNMMALTPGGDLDSGYLFYTLSHLGLASVADMTSIPQINNKHIHPFLIPFPSLSEQRVIAGTLSNVDDLIASLAALIEKKRAMKKGAMRQLLTGKTRLPGFTATWAEGTFEQLAIPSRERAMPGDVPASTPLVELEQLESGSGRLIDTSQASEAVSLKAVFKPGDVLFGKLRAYLRKFWYTDVAGLCTTEIWVLRARAGVSGRFVRYVVETDQFIDVASGAYGTHMPRSDWGTVRAIPVAIPPHDEQVAIASTLRDVDAEISLLHQRLEKVRSVKLGMMQELLTGRTRLLEPKEPAA